MKNKHLKPALLTALFLIHAVITASAQIRLPNVIGNNMLLQRQQAVPVWGWAKPGQQVNVKFAGQQKTATADANGYWKIMLAALNANNKPQQMIITADTSHITLSNILVGEVWLCSGQSNMEYPVNIGKSYSPPKKGIDSAALELTVTNPNIRLFRVEKKYSLPDVTSPGWQVAGGDALAQVTAAGYFFAKNLYNKLHVPVGIISSSWGGSRIEPWTPVSGYLDLPAFSAAAQTKPFVVDSVSAGRMYNSLIHPLAPYALRGFLWYQGESNCMANETNMRYADKMQALVESWRKEWGNQQLPFYSVLIAPYYYTKRKDHVPHTAQTLPEFWEQQIASTKLPYTDIITVTDLVDDYSNIHPSYKWEVGRRLSLVALNETYGLKKIAYSGPRYDHVAIKNDKATIYFKNAEGLKAKDGQPLNYFAIAGKDGNFVDATATITGNSVVVSSPYVPQPVTVRYGWAETANPNLVNNTGIPAFPFRTDAQEWSFKSGVK